VYKIKIFQFSHQWQLHHSIPPSTPLDTPFHRIEHGKRRPSIHTYHPWIIRKPNKVVKTPKLQLWWQLQTKHTGLISYPSNFLITVSLPIEQHQVSQLHLTTAVRHVIGHGSYIFDSTTLDILSSTTQSTYRSAHCFHAFKWMAINV
jgi:hypothetical protein